MICRILVLVLVVLSSVIAEDQNLPIPGTDLVVIAPAEWTISRGVPGAEFVLRGPPVDDAALDADALSRSRPTVAVTVTPLAASDTQAGFAYRCYKDLDRLLTGFHPFDFDFAYTVAGRKWQRVPYHFHTGQLEWQQELYVTASGSMAICLTFGCDRDHYQAHQRQFDRIVALMSGSTPDIEP
ncbi:MAG: hypothetical protein H0V44_16795 [Planctomycetes bacterium]|nr:hypothetical protein [Planctomycetota bacterium]